MTDKKICELEKRIKLLEIEGPPLKESMSTATQRISNMKQDINHYILGENKKIGGYAQ
jgi:chaperonin cofactor prefoldin